MKIFEVTWYPIPTLLVGIEWMLLGIHVELSILLVCMGAFLPFF